jgi:hypothetical protein
MGNEIEKPGSNAFLAYGNAATARSIVGKLLKFSKGDYLAGMEDEEVKLGTQFVAHMPSLCVGWIRWEDNKPPAEQRMGLVAENYQPCKRKELGDLDEDQWERDDDGHPRDPWQFSNYLILIARDGGDLYTFTTSSRGGLSAVGELCKAYGKQMRQRPNQHPIVELDVGSYQHSNRSYGRIKFPIFKIVGWTDKTEIDDGSPVGPENPPGAPTPAAAADGKSTLDNTPRF